MVLVLTQWAAGTDTSTERTESALWKRLNVDGFGKSREKHWEMQHSFLVMKVHAVTFTEQRALFSD